MGAVKEPKTNGKRGPMTRETKAVKLRQFANIVECGRYSDLSDIEIARELKITRKTLHYFKQSVSTLISTPEVELIKIDLIANYNKLRRRLAEMTLRIESKTDNELDSGYDRPEYIQIELKILKEIRETIKDYVKMLEDFGIKEKVPDKHEIEGKFLVVNANYLQDINELE